MSDVDLALKGLIDIREPPRSGVEQGAEFLAALGLGLMIALLIVGLVRVLTIAPKTRELSYSQRVKAASDLPDAQRLIALAAVYRDLRAAECGEPLDEAKGLHEALYQPVSAFDLIGFEAALAGLLARKRV